MPYWVTLWAGVQGVSYALTDLTSALASGTVTPLFTQTTEVKGVTLNHISASFTARVYHYPHYIDYECSNSDLLEVQMVDIHQPGDHKIVLGDSVKDEADVSLSHFGVKYNWIPKSGFENSDGTIKNLGGKWSLNYDDGESQYDYSGWLAAQQDSSPQLALFYDAEKSAFVLEKVAASLEMNMRSGTNLTSDQVKRHAKLERSQKAQDLETNAASADLTAQGDEGPADKKNPFDFRHFLEEAKEAAEKASHHGAGGRTPLPGGRTPLSGVASPLLGAGHHPFQQANTPSFGPLEIVDATGKEMNEFPDRRRQKAVKPSKSKAGATRKPQTTTKARTAQRSEQPKSLSKEVVVDSDSSDDASADMSDRPSPVAAPAVRRPTKTHQRNISNTSIPSIVHDNNGLETEDNTSTARPKSGYKINRDAFRSGTNTPMLGQSTDRPESRQWNADIHMPDADEEEDEDMKYFQDDDEEEVDNNADVDDLVLDEGLPARSPSPPPIQAPKPMKRRQSSILKQRRPRSPSPPRPQHDDLEDDDIAKELEAELEKMQGVDEEDEGGVGLGIGMGGGGDDEEEDISEEE